ncbi:MAG: SusC/RagA family TonB-linked outer membrane protein [Ferruginibacter sp.]|nr:SusC/RagA family TonB-linked outer membrane protein [Ferruginibacter sp.]
MSQKKTMSPLKPRLPGLLHPRIYLSANKRLIPKFLLAIGFCMSAQGSLLFAQTDTLQINSRRDSLSSRSVKLLYNTVPLHLTATATDVVYGKDLLKSPVTNVLSAASGRLTGIYSQQFSGQPLSDGVGISLHGRTPLILVDGVPRDITYLDLEEVESVTVLKDAVSTAMLGVRGANGAILITTRKGTVNKQSISFTAQTAFQQALNLPKTLGAFDYATLRNEAVANELKVNPTFNAANFLYSAADLQAYQDKTDPFGHPDVDWQTQILKKTAKLNRYTLTANGGNTWSKFFVTLEYINQQGLLKEDAANKYPTNNGIKGYTARTNVDINITPKLSGGISLFGRIINGNDAGAGTGNIFSSILSTPNNAYPVFNRDSSLGGNANYQNNIQGQSTRSGYLQSYRRDILTDFFLKRTLDEIVKGLWVKARLSYSSNLLENISRTKPVIVFEPAGGTYKQYGTRADQINTNSIASQGRSTYTEFSAGYSTIINRTHGVDVLAMANKDNIVSNSDLPYIISGLSGKLSYNFRQKYILEAAYGYNGSNRYAPNGTTKRGSFPAVGAAWNIAKEDFAKKLTWLSSLKLYGSYGKSGWDNPGYFAYIQRYNNNSLTYFGTAAGGGNTLIESTLAYPNITWEKANKLNVGVEGSLLKNRLGFTIERYNNKFYDLSIQRGRNTTFLGNTYPNENIGQNRYTGWDFQLSWQENNTGKLNYYMAANASLQNSEVLFIDEVNQPYDYMRRTGAMIGQPFGYVADGLFQSAAEITGKATFVGYTPQPGDIRYKDLNSDGVINQLDQTKIGTDQPLLTYGVNLGLSYKGFDISALVQGVANRNRYLSGNSYFEFQNGGLGQAYEHHLNRWTPTNTNAIYPRLGIGNNTNNQAFSSYWMRSGDYVRLKNVEIGYSFPEHLTSRAKLSSVRVFANGLNLLTATSEKGIDPEVYGGYPIQRLFNFGINIKL